MHFKVCLYSVKLEIEGITILSKLSKTNKVLLLQELLINHPTYTTNGK